MSKKHPLCALCVAPYYLDKNKWAVSMMTVTRKRQGDLIWINTSVQYAYFNRDAAAHQAVRLSIILKVPIYEGIKKGDSVTDDELFELQKYGLLDHLKI